MTFAQRLHARVIGMAEGNSPMPALVQPFGWRSDGILATAQDTLPGDTFPEPELDGWEDDGERLDQEVM